MFVVIIIVAIAAILSWHFFIKPLSYWKNLGVQQSKPWVFLGDSWRTLFKTDSYSGFISQLYNMHPAARCSGIYNFNSPVLLLRDPELIKQITVKEFEHFTDHPPYFDPDVDPLWTNALLFLKGDRWKEIRKTLSPTFTSAKIKNIYILMVETAENFINYFLENEDEIIDIEMKDAYSRFTNDVIATTAFGVKVNSLKTKENTFYEMGKKLTGLNGIWAILRVMGFQIFPKLLKLLQVPYLNKEASKFFHDIINQSIKTREGKNIVRPDMIHLMLEARKEIKDPLYGSSETGKSMTVVISNLELTSQAVIFFFAGFDTVSTAMCYGTYELALNQDIQDRLREEINETQNKGKITYEQLMNMKYMDMVVSETLRKWPPFPASDRVCTKSYTIEPVNKEEVPVPITVGQQVWIPIYGLQRDPKYFPNPGKFDPERFSDTHKNNIVPYTYLPFGVGPRICIGNRFALLEVKTLLFNLLLNFEIVPTKKTSIPLVLSKDFSQMPENGFWVGLKRIIRKYKD